MKKNTLLHTFVSVAAMFALTACPGEEENNGNNTNNTNNTTNNTNNTTNNTTNNETFGSVTVQDQTADPANTVVVEEVVSVGPGFIVIHADDGNGAPGEVLGNTAVADGANDDVSVTLSRDAVDGETLFAMLHVDEGVVGTYEFPGPDGPATDANGDGITPSFAAGYAFRTDAFGDYTRADRLGMPAVSTVLAGTLTNNPSTPIKEAYNSGGPTDDLASAYAPIAIDNLAALHGALRDDLMTLPVCATYDDTDPANTIVNVDTCLNQEVAAGVTVANLIIPDLIVVNPADSTFPSGRKLDDQVIDTTLTVILLDLANANGAAIDANPDANDKAFRDTFPYLAEPH